MNIDQWLDEFWAKYAQPKMSSSALNQVFCRGPYAGYSVRDLVNACVRTGRYKMPEIEFEENNGL